ncbi:MAG: HD domain-containing protein [Candidatus Riflebacteria bacterium]|nr:HD domain-containing protein [Candidatus Riflebacteria bacterium]
MKPLEMSSIAEVWRSALTIIADSLHGYGQDLQIWFPWGKTWRGHDQKGILPPTDLPADLLKAKGDRFAGRFWVCHPQGGVSWLLCVKPSSPQAPGLAGWAPTPRDTAALVLLAEFLRLESLLGLAVRVLENRASERQGHWDRVRNLAVTVGRHLGLAPAELVDLEMTALLHDLGKIALPNEILEESRPLTPAERRQVEGHSLVGAAMIREIPGLERVADYVQSHHETPDGTGYPRGLAAGDIPLVSLIVGAVDAFDAMTHYRPYATERTYKESIQEMIAQTGRFDDRVLWALQDVLKRLGILDTHPMVNPPTTEGPAERPRPATPSATPVPESPPQGGRTLPPSPPAAPTDGPQPAPGAGTRASSRSTPRKGTSRRSRRPGAGRPADPSHTHGRTSP